MAKTEYYGIHILEPLALRNTDVFTIPRENVEIVRKKVSDDLTCVTMFARIPKITLKGKVHCLKKQPTGRRHSSVSLNTLNVQDVEFQEVWLEFGGIFMKTCDAAHYEERNRFISRNEIEDEYEYVKYGEKCKVVLDTTGVEEGAYFAEDIPNVADVYNPLLDDKITKFYVGCIILSDVKLAVEMVKNSNYYICNYFNISQCCFGLFYAATTNTPPEIKYPEVIDCYERDYDYPRDIHKVSSNDKDMSGYTRVLTVNGNKGVFQL